MFGYLSAVSGKTIKLPPMCCSLNARLFFFPSNGKEFLQQYLSLHWFYRTEKRLWRRWLDIIASVALVKNFSHGWKIKRTFSGLFSLKQTMWRSCSRNIRYLLFPAHIWRLLKQIYLGRAEEVEKSTFESLLISFNLQSCTNQIFLSRKLIEADVITSP